MKATLPSGRGGFALVMVVFLLFAVAVAGVTGYQVVSSEFALANQSREGQEALAVARAGLQRFLGEQIGQVGDSVSYAIGNGVAAVTARKVMEQNSLNHLYFIRAVGQVADARTPLLPARRTVGTYAWHRIAPIPQRAAFWLSYDVRLSNSAAVEGADQDVTGLCQGAGTTGGVFLGGQPDPSPSGGSYVSGSPQALTNLGYAAFYDSVAVRWDILEDPSFPVDFDGYYPNFATLLAANPDTFPIVRYTGNHTAGSTSGQGVLIVGGTLTLSSFFIWDGIILAGRLGAVSPAAHPLVSGMLIAGLDGSYSEVRIRSGDYFYDSCKAYKANRSLSYLEVVDNTLFEING